VIYRASLGEVVNVDFFLSFWRDHSNIIYNGWFINSIIVLYIIFYVSFKKKDSKIAIFKLVFFTLVYIFWKVYQNHGDWEYVSIMAFFLGVFWMKDRSLIDKFIEKNYFVFLVSFSILMYVFRRYEVIMKNIGITNKYVYYEIVGNLCTMIFVVYFLLLTNKLNFSNKYLDLLGDISFEIYMIHGLVMHYLGKFFVSSAVNDVIYTIVVLLVSIVFAYCIKKLIIIFEKKLMKTV
jgi:putative acyltransferase